MSKNNPFSQLISGGSEEIRESEESASWEHSRVRHLLKRTGLPKSAERKLLEEAKNFSDVSRLRFDLFNGEYHDFPFAFGTNRLRNLPVPYGKKQTSGNYQVHRDPYSTEPSRFKKFEWVPHVIAFREFQASREGSQDARPIGLIFPRKGFSQGMVIHNDATEQFWDEGLCWVYKDPTSMTGDKLYVQPFDSLLKTIRQMWRPG